MNPALLIIDMQNDFVKENAIMEVPGIRNHLLKFKNFIVQCRKKGVLTIYTRHCFDPKKNAIELLLFPQLKKEGLRSGTKGWQIIDELKPEKNDIFIDKTRYDAFFKTNLKTILEKNKVDTVLITGTMTNVCCESTARTAMQHDYHVLFCSDLTFCGDQEDQKATLKIIKSSFGKVMTSQEILTEIKK
ncbi:cysteine hydrolase [Candidatus Woesearchaeota archaeon]|nr:cysteine hydrolase [Candidatus Woesearchaeota archaeon]